MSTPTIGIIGVGLIGGSIGLRCRELSWNVLGYDIDPQTAALALECKAICEAIPRELIYERCDTIILAAHVQATMAEIERMEKVRPRAMLILDVASVKVPIVRAAARLPRFVATHPMAGAEISGPGAASGALFSGKPWLYVPTDEAALNHRAVEFIGKLGAQPVPIEAAEHDAAVALTSHLPQMLATLFAGRLNESGVKKLAPYCGPTARELSRLSRSNVAMWREIFLANRKHVATELRGLAAELERTARALDNSDAQGIDANFARGNELAAGA